MRIIILIGYFSIALIIMNRAIFITTSIQVNCIIIKILVNTESPKKVDNGNQGKNEERARWCLR